ncbi:hypothetical protein [Actinacidiphila sp. bgisy160]|uniref:hypothetical protein n=1 Tax=Actinacidiphila sp. bgisy160 TaxID=3413796 RepID=UPI003D757C6E
MTLGERAGGLQSEALRGGVPLQTGSAPAGAKRTAAPSGDAWQAAPDLPETVRPRSRHGSGVCRPVARTDV